MEHPEGPAEAGSRLDDAMLAAGLCYTAQHVEASRLTMFVEGAKWAEERAAVQPPAPTNTSDEKSQSASGSQNPQTAPAGSSPATVDGATPSARSSQPPAPRCANHETHPSDATPEELADVQDVTYTLFGLPLTFPLCADCLRWFDKFYESSMKVSNRGK